MAPPPKKPAARGARGKGKEPPKPKPGKRLVYREIVWDRKKLVDRPPYRRVFVDRGPQWLVLEPHRLGMAAGALFAMLTLICYNLAGWLGSPVATSQVLIGVMATFVVSYAAVGAFVWYLLMVADREFGPQVEPEKKTRSLLGLGDIGAAAVGAEATHAEPEHIAAPAQSEPEETL